MRYTSRGILWWTLLLGLLCPFNASAYTTIMTVSGQPYTWSQSHIKWTLHSSGCADLSLEKTRASIQAAFDSWANVPCSDLTFEYAGTSAEQVPGTIFLRFDSNFSFQGSDGALAYGGPTGIVVFNESYTWSEVAVNGQGNLQDLQAVTTHELGHVLGLSHTLHPNATMYFVGGAMNERNLGQDDINGLCFLYPAPGYIFMEGENCDYCTVQSNCSQGACVPHSWEGGSYCAQFCTYDSQCPIGFRCKAHGTESVCMPEFNHCTQSGNNIPFGDYCWGNETCSTGYCFTSGKGQYDAFCTSFCDQGLSCPANSECAFGALCIPPECDPVQDIGCPIGQRCLWYNKQASGPGADSVTGRCVKENDGGSQGAVCGGNLPGCQPDLTCVFVDWMGSWQCVSDCRYPSGLGCDSSSSCLANEQSGHPERGYCLPKEPVPPASDLVHANDNGLPGNIDIVASSDLADSPKLPGAPLPPKAEHPGSSSLCSGHPGHSRGLNPGFWLLLSSLVLIQRRRIKRPSPDQRRCSPEAAHQ